MFCEDVAASGGYWLACSGDEIYADDSSIIGSIGVISAGFGFVEALASSESNAGSIRLAKSKSILDPFQPEKPEDVERLLGIQGDVHEAFKALVRSRRKDKLAGDEKELFSGAFWAGRKALTKGLIDGIGHLHDVIERKFGEKVVLKTIQPSQGWGLKRLGFGVGAEISEGLAEAMETRALWQRFGL